MNQPANFNRAEHANGRKAAEGDSTKVEFLLKTSRQHTRSSRPRQGSAAASYYELFAAVFSGDANSCSMRPRKVS